MITTKEYEDLGIGETLRQNHRDCPAGRDERQRQYITRPESDPTKLIWHCHNCGNGGLMTDPTYEKYRDDKFASHVVPELENGEVTEPAGLTADPTLWPTEAKVWQYKRGLADDYCVKYGVKHDPSTNSMYFPRYHTFYPSDCRGYDYAGYQLRSLYSGPKKYITVLAPDKATHTLLGDAMTDDIVVVEDLVSAIRIYEATGLSCCILYGVRCEPTVMYELANSYNTVTVWLDNDQPNVLRMAGLIAKTINFYDPTVQTYIIPERFEDAKYYHDSEIKEILNGLH